MSSTVLYVVDTNNALNSIDSMLLIEYENVGNELRSTMDSSALDSQRDTIDHIDHAINLGLLIFVFDTDGNLIDSTSTLQNIKPFPSSGYHTLRIGDQDYRFYQSTLSGFPLMLGIDLHVYNTNNQTLALILVVTILCISIFAFFLGYVFSVDALRPIDRLIAEIDRINIHDPDTYLRVDAYIEDEIGTLASRFHQFVTKIHETLTREREFTEDVSHDLRTPLMVISTSLELLENNNLSAYQHEKIQLIATTTTRMERILEYLLILARDMQNFKREDTSVGAFLTEYVASIRSLAVEKGLDLRLDIHNDIVLLSHPFLLEQAVGNLIRNAIRYTPSGSVTVTVDGRQLSIEDTGIGIDPTDIDKIWTRFYRAGDKQGKDGGFGVGLSIVRRIADQEDWRIVVDSTIGRGTRFDIIFDEKKSSH